ncbi:MAG: hypothetical protein QOJ09_1720 [Actinomycetota bacterium]|nr:hypothetical protein [Actinomycetota bacterium]
MKQMWARLGGQLGLGCAALGLLFIALAWNGAASVDFVQGQVPYLLSGGAIGLALVVLGAALVIVQNSRRDRALLEAQLQELNRSIGRLAAALGGTNGNGSTKPGGAEAEVVLGRTSFHRTDCRLVGGKDLPTGTLAIAEAEGLAPCRICRPADLPAVASRR